MINKYMISKLVAGTKVYGVVNSEEGLLRVEHLEWSARGWLMEFNMRQIILIHFGKLNQARIYTMNNRVLGVLLNSETLGYKHIPESGKRVVRRAYALQQPKY